MRSITFCLPHLGERVGPDDLGVDERVLLEEVVQHARRARPPVARSRLDMCVRCPAPMIQGDEKRTAVGTFELVVWKVLGSLKERRNERSTQPLAA